MESETGEPRELDDGKTSSGTSGNGALCQLLVDRIRTSFAHLRPGRLPLQPDAQLADGPLRVVPTDDGYYEILDGFKKFEMWCEAGRQTVPAIVERPLATIDHKRLMLVANSPPRTLTALDEALVVESLITDDHLTANAVAQQLGRKPDWVARRRQLANRLSIRAQEELARGRIGPSTAYALTALAAEDQDRVLEAVLKHRLRATDAVLLVTAYRVADDVDREQILRDPRGALTPDPSPILTPRATELEGRLERFRQLLADVRTFTLPDDLPESERHRLEALQRSLYQDLVDTVRVLESAWSVPAPVEPEPHEASHPKSSSHHDQLEGGTACDCKQADAPAEESAEGQPAQAAEEGGHSPDAAGHREPARVLRNPPDRRTRARVAQGGPSSVARGGMQRAAQGRSSLEDHSLPRTDQGARSQGVDDLAHPPRDPGTGVSWRANDPGPHVRQLRVQHAIEGPKKKVKRRFETDPGREMQADWSPFRVSIGGQRILAYALTVILCHCRKLFLGFFRDEREHTLLEGLARAFEYFEGCAIDLVIDNMATAVLGRIGPDRKPIWHPTFLEFARHYGINPIACAARDPDRKGKIEKPFRLVYDDFLKEKTFRSWDDLFAQSLHWLDHTTDASNLRVHGTTGQVPNEAYLAERDFLIRLPRERFPVYEDSLRIVDNDCTLSVLDRSYSVPSFLASRTVPVRLFAHHFEVIDRNGRVAFSRAYVGPEEKRKLLIDRTHYAGLPRRPKGSHNPDRLDEVFLLRFPTLAALVDGLKLKMKTLAPVHLRKLLRLADAYGQDAFLAAATRVQDFRRFDALAVARILERDHPEPPDEPITPLSGVGAVALGEVDPGSLDDFGHLDEDPVSSTSADTDKGTNEDDPDKEGSHGS